MRVFKITILIILISIASATSFQELSMADMLERSQIAFYGRVSAIEFIEKQSEPWTKVDFEIINSLYGLEDKKNISLLFYGGSVNGKTTTVSLMPRFSIDEKVLVLAYKNEYYSPIVGFRQGLWREQALGLTDETDQILSLNDKSELILAGDGASTDDILAAFKKAFEAKK